MKSHNEYLILIINRPRITTVVAFILFLSSIISAGEIHARDFDPNEPADRSPERTTIKKHPFSLIDRQLTEKIINLISITKGKIQFTDQLGRAVSLPLDDVLLLLRIDDTATPEQAASATPQNDNLIPNNNPDPHPGPPDPNSEPQNNKWAGPFIRLTDGRSLTGQINTIIDDGSTVIWRNDIIGRVRVSVDDITRLYLRPTSSETKFKNDNNLTTPQPQPIAPTDEAGDSVELVNGDRMVGFISFQDSQNLIIETDRDNTTLALSRISSITLENDPTLPPANACRIVLDDGSIFDIDQTQLFTRGEGIRLAPVEFSPIHKTESPTRTDMPTPSDHWADFNSLRAIAFHAGSIKSLTTLAAQTDRQQETQPYERTRWFDSIIPPVISNENKQPLSLNDLRYEGPGEFQYHIPQSAVRFAARASVPRSALDWADFNLVILVDGRELYLQHYDANHPMGEIIINLPEQSNTLAIRIEENGRGPIEDIITLHHPFFLLNPVPK